MVHVAKEFKERTSMVSESVNQFSAYVLKHKKDTNDSEFSADLDIKHPIIQETNEHSFSYGDVNESNISGKSSVADSQPWKKEDYEYSESSTLHNLHKNHIDFVMNPETADTFGSEINKAEHLTVGSDKVSHHQKLLKYHKIQKVCISKSYKK